MFPHFTFFFLTTNYISAKRLLEETHGYPAVEDTVKRIILHANQMPSTDGGPLVVKIGFYIESLSNFGTGSMSFDMDIYFRGTWKDTRFVHNNSLPVVITKQEHIEHFWIPDLYFANARRSWFQDLLRPNTYVRIFGNGEIFYSTRITLELSCNQDLRKYPMDRQTCGAIIKSYSHTTSALQLKWLENNITANSNILLPELAVVGEVAQDCTTTHTYAETDSFSMQGNFSCLSASIILERQVGHHVVQTYVPTALIVIVSWLSFCIEPTSAAARVSLSFTTLLTLSTIASGVRTALPPVAYAKAIDIWIGACTMFVFLSLVEFAVVNSFVRAAADIESVVDHELWSRDMKSTNEKLRGSTNEKDQSESESLLKQRLTRTAQQKRLFALKIDYSCRVLFPVAFGLFNLVYWTHYLA